METASTALSEGLWGLVLRGKGGKWRVPSPIGAWRLICGRIFLRSAATAKNTFDPQSSRYAWESLSSHFADFGRR